ncbi:hypothetical protein CkaCkLH20_12839 [Colletotrichum karsti]|uniref:Uncharacterized protein n=1 Tax=Colletotrichum karsti TaxID=1095194 RepID=A0A9P6HS55_9PEZI|nr:uncharacterized protein CkaCkLH20_12839 [Colletotrichum karsti]KAF9869652.1 hypothetical protein CkaCkLH20_12839 [Colletotrichum karsti]
MSLSVIAMAGDQRVRIPTMRYDDNNSPVHLYVNIQDGNNLREVAVTIYPGSQQVSCEFAMTNNSEISARQDEFHYAKELVARIPIAKRSGEGHRRERPSAYGDDTGLFSSS